MIKKGFTLIELLVVITIIAIIASIGVANFLTAQKQARDSKRQSMMLQIQSAFEQYFVEFNYYPDIVTNNLKNAFEDLTLPLDPKNSGEYVINWTNTTTDEYCICDKLESQLGNADAPSSTLCNWNTTGGAYFCVQNKQ